MAEGLAADVPMPMVATRDIAGAAAAALAAGLVAAGVSPGFASLHVEMTEAIDAQRLQPRGGRHDGNITPTSFEDFALRFGA